MIPSRNQFRRWSYPSKFAFVSFFISVAITIAVGMVQWLFPESGKSLVERLVSGPQQTVQVPGRNAIEKQLNLAKLEGVTALESSAEFAVAIPFVRPALAKGTTDTAIGANVAALSNASPLRSENQDVVFAPGKCRFLGTVHWAGQPALRGESVITVVSCVLDNGDSYQLGVFGGPAIGFVAPANQPVTKELSLVREGSSVTLPRDGRYIVRFYSPLRDIPFKGKSVSAW